MLCFVAGAERESLKAVCIENLPNKASDAIAGWPKVQVSNFIGAHGYVESAPG